MPKKQQLASFNFGVARLIFGYLADSSHLAAGSPKVAAQERATCNSQPIPRFLCALHHYCSRYFTTGSASASTNRTDVDSAVLFLFRIA